MTSAVPRRDPKSGTWWFIVDLPADEVGRRRQAKRRGFRTKAAAQEALDDLRVAARHGTFVAPARQRVGDFLSDDWLPAVRRELAESTWESYDRNIRNHVVPRIGQIQLQALDGGALNRLYAELLLNGRKLGKQSAGLKPRTVRYIHTIIHAALDDAVRWRRIPLNPSDQANPPSAAQSKPPEMRVWTADQLRRFLALNERDRNYWPWFFSRPPDAAAGRPSACDGRTLISAAASWQSAGAHPANETIRARQRRPHRRPNQV